MTDIVGTPENLTSQSLFIEEYKLTKIHISTTENNNGVLEKDENNNNLNSKLNVGDVKIESVIGVITDNLLLYTSDKNKYMLINSSSNNTSYKMVWDKPIMYKIGAKTLYNQILNSNHTINIPNTYSLFALYINNNRIQDNEFTIVGQVITLSTKLVKKLDLVYNTVNMVVYPTNQTITTPIELHYLSVKEFFNATTFRDESYFNNNNIREHINYESFKYDEEITNETYGNDRRKNILRTNMIAKINISYFVGEHFLDFANDLLGKTFRIVINHPNTNSMEIFPNCVVTSGYKKDYAKEKNTVEVEIQTDGRYEIKFENQPTLVNRPYNSGTYNNGIYG
jgi:hypothetical protein